MSQRFSDQFRQSAVEMVSPEHPIAEVAHSLGIGYPTLDKWVRAHRRQTGQLAALNAECRTPERRSHFNRGGISRFGVGVTSSSA